MLQRRVGGVDTAIAQQAMSRDFLPLTDITISSKSILTLHDPEGSNREEFPNVWLVSGVTEWSQGEGEGCAFPSLSMTEVIGAGGDEGLI